MTNKMMETIQPQLDQLVASLPQLKNNEQWATITGQVEHLSQTVTHQERLLETAAAISDAASSILDVDELLNVSTNLIQNNFDTHYVGIFLIDETNQWAELKADTKSNGHLQPHRLKIADDTTICQAINQQKPAVSTDAKFKTIADPSAEHSEVALPLISRGQVIGALIIQSVQHAIFSSQNLRALQTLADQLANAIHNATLFATADRQLGQLIALHNINLQIGSHFDIEALLSDVAQLSATLLSADGCVIKTANERRKTFTVRAVNNPPQGVELNQTHQMSDGLSGEVAQTGQPVLANNWPNHPLGAPTADDQVKAALAVPITIHTKIIGTIEVYSFNKPYAFDDNDLYTLSLLASQTATAIEKTRLFNQAEHSYLFLETVIDHIPDPIFIKNRDHTWVAMNQANADILGRPKQELIGKTDEDYFPQELAQEFYRRDDEVFTTNRISEYEDKTVWADDQKHDAYTRLIPVPGESGEPEYLLGITQDITERKAQEAERERFLAETEALYNGSRAISTALSERQIFEALFEQIRLEEPCEIAVFNFERVDDELIWAELKAGWQKHNNPTYSVGKRFYLPETPHARLLTATEPMFIEDLAADAGVSKKEREGFAPTQAHSIAVLPLASSSQTLGSVIIHFTTPHTFSEVTRRFWLAMVDQAGVALNNRRLVQAAAYRAVQMETAAEVAQAASSLLELNELLNSSVELIRDRFELYYVGAFLVDEAEEWAVLRAGTGRAGQVQLKNNHRLKIGGESMIGWSIAHQQPRIALDVGKEAVHFQNPHLPDTRSEMALPLIHRNKAIGALTVQSTEQAAFSREDIIFLQTMANQLANAIVNAQLFEQAQQEIAERKRAEEALRASEAKYRELVENANSIILRINTKGQITFFNEFAQEFFGFSEEEILGQPVVGTIVPEVDSAGRTLSGMFDDIIQHPEKYARNENENIRRNGERVWVSWSNTVIPDESGQLTEILCVGNDSTERKRAEEEILRRHEELAMVNRVTETVTSTLDLNEMLQAIAQEMVQIFKARRCGIALLNSDRTKLSVVADHSAQAGDASGVGVEIPVVDNPSSVRVIETGESLVISQAQTNPLTEPIHDLMRRRETHCLMIVPLLARGEVIGTIGVDLDQVDREFTATEVSLAETIAGQIANAVANAHLFEQTQNTLAQLRQAEEELLKFKLGIERSGEAVFLTDTDGQIVYINPGFEKIYGYSQKEALGKTPRILKSGVMPPEAYTEFWNRLLAKETVVGEIVNKTKNGDLISVEGSSSPVLDDDGNIIGFLAIQHDITERKRAEEALQKALDRTETLYRIGDTLASASDQQTTFETVLGEYLRLLNLKRGGLMLFDETSTHNKVHALYIDGQPVESDLMFPVEEDLVARHLIEHPEPLVIEDVSSHPLTKDSHHLRGPVEAMLLIPLLIRNQVVGLIGADATEKGHTFSQDDIGIGQVVADHLGIWLENRRLLSEAQRRSHLLQTAAEVSRSASSILDVDELINTSVNIIRDQFDFYYVGLFLVDEERKWAVLRAGTGQAGRIQLERNHRLEIGGESMIGWSVANRKARIALDVGEEAVHFKNPILPDTHSEMALPLVSRDEVIGALTVQSTERGAFSDEDITLLQTMADQLANVLSNARLFERVAQSRKEAESRLQETQALQQLSQKLAGTLNTNEILDIFFQTCQEEIGFEYMQFSMVDKYQHRVRAIRGVGVTENQIQQSSQPLDSDDIMADIVRTGKTEVITGWDERFNQNLYQSEGHENWVRVFAPVTLRQENIGLVEAGFNKNIQSTIHNSQVRLLRAFIDQTALALDSAQRYQASQQAARREALIKEITTKVRASTNLDTILQTTVKEIGDALGSKRTYIHLAPERDANGHSKNDSKVERA